MPHDQRLRTLPPEALREPTLAFPRALAARSKFPLPWLFALEKALSRCGVACRVGCAAGCAAGREVVLAVRAAVLADVDGRAAARVESPYPVSTLGLELGVRAASRFATDASRVFAAGLDPD
jgi:hypothetical protein